MLPEDLIYRFAQKLEFGEKTAKVADAAVRLVQRMSIDWMVMGRRPSGVCGACLIMAARMNNFRRTVTEVVYIVKVHQQTIQKRLDEFKMLPSSALTVEEFLTNEFLESAHDPPAFYEKSEDFQREKRGRKRKRTDPLRRNATESEVSTRNRDGTVRSTLEPQELRRDTDGFLIPPTPRRAVPSNGLPTPAATQQVTHDNIDPALLPQQATVGALPTPTSSDGSEVPESDPSTTFTQLFNEIGHLLPEDNVEEPLTEAVTRPKPKRSLKAALDMIASKPLPPEWQAIEKELDTQIEELASDPHTSEHALQYAHATKRAKWHVMMADAARPPREVSMEVEIDADEFADDPEVQNCLLAAPEVAIKEKVWVNENKEWLAKQQQKDFRRRLDARGPKKATRHRVKKPRIGEGQTSVASSPAEAAISVLKARSWSKKINYEALGAMFDDAPGNALGSAATSRVTSRAPSIIDDGTNDGDGGNEDDHDDDEHDNVVDDDDLPDTSRDMIPILRGSKRSTIKQSQARDADASAPTRTKDSLHGDADGDGDASDPDDYINEDDTFNGGADDPADGDVEDWRKGLGVALGGDGEFGNEDDVADADADDGEDEYYDDGGYGDEPDPFAD